MADAKISALPAATTPLAGTEVLPIVQSSATEKVTVQQVLTGVIITEATTSRVLSASDSGQTLVSYSSLFSTIGQYAVISLICPVANTFLAAGNLGV